jgi:hypothetical protein
MGNAPAVDVPPAVDAKPTAEPPDVNGDAPAVDVEGPTVVVDVESRKPRGSTLSYHSVGLAQVEWREYHIDMKWFFHPCTMAIICVQNAGYMINTVIPDITFVGYVLTYCAAILPSRPWYAVVVAMTGLAPRWATILGGLMFAVLSAAAWYFKHSGSTGLLVAMVLWTATMLPFVKKRVFMLAIVTWLILVQISIALVLTYHHKIVEALHLDSVMAGLVLPVTAAVYSNCGFTSICFILRHCNTEGAPSVIFSLMVCTVVGTTQILQLSALVEAGKHDSLDKGLQQMGVCVATAMIGEFWKRGHMNGRIMHAVTRGRRPCIISAERDVYIRTAYYVDFTVLPSFLFIGMWCFATGVPFAQRLLFWIAFPVFILESTISDVVMFLIHRFYYPVENESAMQTLKRLNMPGQNMPTLQADAGRRFYHYKETGEFLDLQSEAKKAGRCSQGDVEIWCAKWSQHPTLSDELCAVIGYMVLMANMSRISFTAFFGQCGITVAEHLCQEVGATTA